MNTSLSMYLLCKFVYTCAKKLYYNDYCNDTVCVCVCVFSMCVYDAYVHTQRI